jgi:hypothetical protein
MDCKIKIARGALNGQKSLFFGDPNILGETALKIRGKR